MGRTYLLAPSSGKTYQGYRIQTPDPGSPRHLIAAESVAVAEAQLLPALPAHRVQTVVGRVVPAAQHTASQQIR
jgi:hypothetical protein